MTIDSGGLDSFRLFTGRALSLREQKFALEQARFDRAARRSRHKRFASRCTSASSIAARGSMLRMRARSNARYDRTSSRVLTRVWSASPSRQTRRRDRWRLLCGPMSTSEISSSTRSLGHIIRILHPAASRPAGPEHPASGFLLASRRWRLCPRSLGLGPRMRQRHAAEVMPVVGTAAGPVRASPSRACGQP